MKLPFHLIPIRQETKRPLCLHGEKDASCDPEVIARWRKRFPGCNWAVATGPSGLIAVDMDSYKPEFVPGLLQKVIALGVLPKTVSWASARGGLVFLYKRPESIDVKPGSLARVGIPAVDVKGSAGYVLIPPSQNADGGRYLWINAPSETPIADAPSELVELLTMEEVGDGGASPGLSVEGELYLKAGDGRWNRLQRFAGGLRRWGWGAEAILRALSGFAEEQCEPDESIGPEKLRELAEWAGGLPVDADHRAEERVLMERPGEEARPMEKDEAVRAVAEGYVPTEEGEEK